MTEKITGQAYRSMLGYGISHLDRNRKAVNDLNVFPVPDGDTGTNMVMTMKNGYRSIDNDEELSRVAKSFANAAVFGARGNSGVIVSQFFKGISVGLADVSEADCQTFCEALRLGCDYAYASVSKPVEGTILTVLREATDAVRESISHLHTPSELVERFLQAASVSLKNTPNLLPILQKAGVVDSGGAGIVYFFEGIRKYLNGEPLESLEGAAPEEPAVDYTRFHRNSSFPYGYCTEVLLQITRAEDAFDYQAFAAALKDFGDSIVTSLEGDKVKLHLHTKHPEQALAFCHAFGEFLSLKIENMSVQHTERTQKFLCAEEAGAGLFATVAVAPNPELQKMLSEMGADVVIMSEEVPSSQDFLEAFEHTASKHILVFPNSSNSILSAMQAGSLYKGAHVTVLNCRSIAECYPALAIIDYDSTDIKEVIAQIDDTIQNIYEVAIVHASKNIHYGNKSIVKNDYFALSGDDVLFSAPKFEAVVLQTAQSVLAERDCGVMTLFYGKNVSEEKAAALADTLRENNADIDVCSIPTQSPIYDLILSFE